MIIYDYFLSVFCIVPQKVLLLKYRKWRSHLKNRYHYAKVVENVIFFEVALSAVLCNGAVSCIMNVWGYHHWNTGNTTLDIYFLFKSGHKSTQISCKVCSNLTTIDFFLTSVLFINLDHLFHPSLALLFMLWKDKCWLKMRRKLFVKLIQWC